MDQQFPDLPTTPMPVARPPRKRRKLWVIALAIVGVALIVGIGAGIVVNVLSPSRSQASHIAQASGANATSQSSQNQSTTVASTATAGATSTLRVTPTTKQQRGQSSSPHGRPRLGGPRTDFFGKYGSHSDQGDTSSVNFWTGTDQTIDLNVNGNDQGNVAQVTVLGADTWTASQTQSYCKQFLPAGATQTSSSANLITYSSHAGTVHLNLQSATSCSLVFARA